MYFKALIGLHKHLLQRNGNTRIWTFVGGIAVHLVSFLWGLVYFEATIGSHENGLQSRWDPSLHLVLVLLVLQAFWVGGVADSLQAR